MESYWTSLVHTAFQTEDESHWPALCGLLNHLTRES